MVHLLFTQKQAALVLYVLTLVQSASPGSLYGPFTVHPETSGPRAVRVNSSAHSPHREVCVVHPETSGSHAVQWRILMNYYKPRTKGLRHPFSPGRAAGEGGLGCGLYNHWRRFVEMMAK